MQDQLFNSLIIMMTIDRKEECAAQYNELSSIRRMRRARAGNSSHVEVLVQILGCGATSFVIWYVFHLQVWD